MRDLFLLGSATGGTLPDRWVIDGDLLDLGLGRWDNRERSVGVDRSRCRLDSSLLDNDGLLLGRLAGAEETAKGSEETEETEKSGKESSRDLGHLLEGASWVKDEEVAERVEASTSLVDNAELLGVLLIILCGTLLLLLDGLLDVVSLLGELLGILLRVANVNVVKEDVLGHGPELDTDTTNGLEVGRLKVLVKVGVVNAARTPNTLVRWVGLLGTSPDALVVGVLDLGAGPWATTRNLLALGVVDSRCDPVSILLVIPLLGLLGLRVGDLERLVNEPVLGLSSRLVLDHQRCILVPVIGLDGVLVINEGVVYPVVRLGVVGVVNGAVGVDRGTEVLEKGSRNCLLVVDKDAEVVVGLNNKGVESSSLGDLGQWCLGQVLLLVLASKWVLVAEDKVDLVGLTTTVRSEHDGERRLVCVVLALLEAAVGISSQELDVGTTALESLLELDLVLDNKRLALGVNGLGEESRDGMVSSL